MLKFLNKPYPFNDDLKHNAKIIFFISLGILGFLLLFQPIEISSLTNTEVFYLVSGLAASTFLILTLNLIVVPSLLPRLFYNNVWNIKREIVWNIWILFTISGSDILFYSKLFNIMDIHFSDIVTIILLGLLPVSVLIIINQDRLFRSHLKSAQQLNRKLLEGKQQAEKLIHFVSDYKKDNLILKPDTLLLIKSADNYIEVYYKSEGRIKKQMIRSSLKKAEESILDFDFIIKCHRTFVVNINHIKEIQGNSQGYKLSIEDLDFPVLVSQKYIKDLQNIL